MVISTHPRERLRWLERGVVSGARDKLDLPVAHVVVDLDAERANATAAGSPARG